MSHQGFQNSQTLLPPDVSNHDLTVHNQSVGASQAYEATKSAHNINYAAAAAANSAYLTMPQQMAKLTKVQIKGGASRQSSMNAVPANYQDNFLGGGSKTNASSNSQKLIY